MTRDRIGEGAVLLEVLGREAGCVEPGLGRVERQLPPIGGPEREAGHIGQAGLAHIDHDPGLGLERVPAATTGQDERQQQRGREHGAAHRDQESTSTAATSRIISANSPDR